MRARVFPRWWWRGIPVGCRAVILGVVALASARPALGQVTCRPSEGSSEARLLSFYSVPLAFGSALPTPALTVGQVALALELSHVPTPSADVRRIGECYSAKTENTALSAVLPRPRVAVGLPGGVVLEGSYLPPVTVADATPSLLGVALSFGLPRLGRVVVRGRVHATVGYVDGPITCAASALQGDPSEPCFGAEPSTDRYAPNVYGGELLGEVPLASSWQLHVGAGLARARPRFQVGFADGNGVLDRTRVAREFTALSATVGVSRLLSPRWSVGALGYGVAGDGATVRLTAQWLVSP